jgi:glycolate oxidase
MHGGKQFSRHDTESKVVLDAQALVEELRSALSTPKVLVDPRALEDYQTDMAEYKGVPAVVVKPSSEADVAKVVEIANRMGVPILARGAGSSLTGAAVLTGGIILDMREMNKVLRIDPVNWYVQVQPGISLWDLNAELKKQGFFFPPDPASSYICTVGGAIAEGSGGLRCVRYGTMKDWVLSVRLVLPSGKVAKFGEPLPKNRAGYDLLHLIVGSEGTLGVITEAYLKIIPVPTVPMRRFLATFDSWGPIGLAITKMRSSGMLPGLFEFLDRDHIHALNEKLEKNLDEAEATLIVDMEEPSLEKMIELLKSCGALTIHVAKDEHEAEELYEIRANALLAVKSLAPAAIVGDVTVPLDKLGDYLKSVKGVATENGLRIFVMGHAGDGNVHPTILYDDAKSNEKESMARAFDELCRRAVQMGGTVTGEHGVGVQKMKVFREQLQKRDGTEALALMKRIKEVFDPNGIMNPGKYVEGA